MTGADLKAWRKRLGFSPATLADQLASWSLAPIAGELARTERALRRAERWRTRELPARLSRQVDALSIQLAAANQDPALMTPAALVAVLQLGELVTVEDARAIGGEAV